VLHSKSNSVVLASFKLHSVTISVLPPFHMAALVVFQRSGASGSICAQICITSWHWAIIVNEIRFLLLIQQIEILSQASCINQCISFIKFLVNGLFTCKKYTSTSVFSPCTTKSGCFPLFDSFETLLQVYISLCQMWDKCPK